MDHVRLEALERTFSQSASRIAIIDTNYVVEWTNCSDIFDRMLDENNFVAFSVKPDRNNKYGLGYVKQETELYYIKGNVTYSASVLPLYYKVGNRIEGFVITLTDPLRMFKKLSDTPLDRAWSKYIEMQRSLIGTTIYTGQSVKRKLERLELFDYADHASQLVHHALDTMAMSVNLEEFIKYASEEPAPKLCNLSANVNQTVLAAQLKIARSDVKIECDIEPFIAANLDYEHLRIALMNVIVNGIMYNISEEKVVNVKLGMHGDDAVLTVSDNGLGISTGRSMMIFSPFACSYYSRNNEGLGLSLAKLFCETSHSRLTYATKQNEGTTIVFTIPAEKVSRERFKTMKVDPDYKFEEFNAEAVISNKLNIDTGYIDETFDNLHEGRMKRE